MGWERETDASNMSILLPPPLVSQVTSGEIFNRTDLSSNPPIVLKLGCIVNHGLHRPHPGSMKRSAHTSLTHRSLFCSTISISAPSLMHWSEILQHLRPTQMNLFCHDQVQGWGWLRGLDVLTLTWRQIGRVLGSVFPLGCSCREAGASAVSHFHDSNHTHFPTDLLRKMLQQRRDLPRSLTKSGAALSALLTRRGRRPGRLLLLIKTRMFGLEAHKCRQRKSKISHTFAHWLWLQTDFKVQWLDYAKAFLLNKCLLQIH